MDRFLLEDAIGCGGFGTVYRCRRVIDGALFAQKRLDDDSDPTVVERFFKEVRILSRLDHPNIVRVVDKGLSEKPYWYVMPLYTGSLWTRLSQVVGDADRIHRIFSSILAAVEHAHGQGVIHRDLKPENVLLGEGDTVAVSDFGLGRLVSADPHRLTGTGHLLGTTLYGAPEQMTDAKRADHRADIYALGRILYEMHAGPMKAGATDLGRMPPGIALVVVRCTQVDPADRFPTIGDLRRTWEAIHAPTGSGDGARGADPAEFQALRVACSVPGAASAEETRRLLWLLASRTKEADLVHETVMRLDATALRDMQRADPEAFRAVLGVFLRVMEAQGWPLAYADAFGHRCLAMHRAIQDAAVRAALVRVTLLVGVLHDRGRVLRVLGEMLEAGKVEGEVAAVCDVLREIPPEARVAAAGRVHWPRVAPEIAEMFR